MASHIGSSRVSSSDEYVTNWWSVAASLAIVAVAAVVVVVPLVMSKPDASAPRVAEVEVPRAALHVEAAPPAPIATPEAVPATTPTKISGALQASLHAALDTAAVVARTRIGPAQQALAMVDRVGMPTSPVAVEVRDGRVRQYIPSDIALYHYLASEVPEISLDAKDTTVPTQPDNGATTTANTTDEGQLLDDLVERESGHFHLKRLEQLTRERVELAGLPLRDASECLTPPEVAKHRGIVSMALRREARLGSKQITGSSLWRPLCETTGETPKYEKLSERYSQIIKRSGRRHDVEPDVSHCASVLEQVMQVEDCENRLALIDFLATISGPEASIALARRAIFDIDSGIRQAAIAALSSRPKEEYLSTLREAKSHPLALAGVRAKQALVKLDNQAYPAGNEATEALASHVSAPYRKAGGGWVVNELVKVNHLRNCLMCHPQSDNASDLMRGPIPVPGQQLPVVYYSGSQGKFVRADVVYLKPDFSLPLAVEDAAPWPTMQRFDFFVRTRPANAGEMMTVHDHNAERRTAFALQAVAAMRIAVQRFQDEALWLVADLSDSRS